MRTRADAKPAIASPFVDKFSRIKLTLLPNAVQQQLLYICNSQWKHTRIKHARVAGNRSGNAVGGYPSAVGAAGMSTFTAHTYHANVVDMQGRLNLRCGYPHVQEDESPDGRSGIGFEPTGVSLTADVGHAIAQQVLNIIGGGDNIAQSAATYFSTIPQWFPIINRDGYYAALSGPDEPPEFSLLTLCMYLIAVPCRDGVSAGMDDLYVLVNNFIAALTAARVNSLDLLRCRLLLSLYEVGHGMYSAAYMSMGTSIRAAEVLGVDRDYVEGAKSTEASDARCVWLGLVVLDRYISLELGRVPSIAVEDSSAIEEVPSQLNSLYHASGLLSTVLSHVHGSLPYLQRSAEAIPILEELASFRNSHHASTPDTALCPAMSIYSSTIMTMLEFGSFYGHPKGMDCSPLAIALLEAEVRQYLVCLDNVLQDTSLAAADFPVFAIHSIGKSAIIIIRHFKASEVIDVPASMERLKSLLRRIAGRCHAAAVYFDRIQEEEESCSLDT
ncbi:fungal specific transcription factor domain-containing protein [Aspergillus stella-maris]|uniref:fungal specific transcription factor domain-containing protein n=1 Tax=Aspergillus stella-maris TaxID=1810926 RepID=UPI003CCCA6B9